MKRKLEEGWKEGRETEAEAHSTARISGRSIVRKKEAFRCEKLRHLFSKGNENVKLVFVT